MRPVHTAESNFVYTGPTPEVGDLHCRVDSVETTSVWWLTPSDREAIAAGANILLGIAGHPIPPVFLEVTPLQGDGNDAPDVLERLESLR